MSPPCLGGRITVMAKRHLWTFCSGPGINNFPKCLCLMLDTHYKGEETKAQKEAVISYDHRTHSEDDRKILLRVPHVLL